MSTFSTSNDKIIIEAQELRLKLVQKLTSNRSIVSLQESIEKSFTFIEESIEIRIESLKNKYDQLHDNLLFELDKIESKLVVKNLSKSCILTSVPKFEFNANNQDINKSSVGKIRYREADELNKRLEVGQYDMIEIDVKQIYDILNPINEFFIIVDIHNTGLCLLDKNFKLVKRIYKINGKEFNPVCLSTNNDNNEIFITDVFNNKIIKTDFEFNQLSVFGGRQGSSSVELNRPWGIQYYKGFVYVCDMNNNRIQKLTSDLQFHQSFPLGYAPFRITISNDFACIRGSQHSISFYELSSFLLRYKYDRESVGGLIGLVNSLFYEYYNGFIYCYNENGELYDQVKIKKYKDQLNNYVCQQLLYLNNRLILFTSELKNKLILI